MPQPYDYSLNVPDPSAAFMQGMQNGNAMQAMQIQQTQQQQALAQQQIQQRVVNSLLANQNPTADDYSRATLAVPGLREQFDQSWKMRNEQQQQAALGQLGQVHAALSAGKPEIAEQLVRDQQTALKNSGAPDAQVQAVGAVADMIKTDPKFALAMTGMKLASAPGGDKVLTNLSTLGGEGRAQAMAPSTLAQSVAGARKTAADASTAEAGLPFATTLAQAGATKAVADAGTAQSEQTIKGVAASNAPTATVLGNEEKAQQIKASKLAGDIAQLTAQIGQANSETERGKLTLEREKMLVEQAKLTQSQGVAAQDAQNQSTMALQTVQDIKTHRGMDGYFTGPGTKWGAVWRMVPGSDRQALETHIDALKGQLGYSNLMAAKAASPTGASGFGALSEGELKLLSNLAGNLDPNSADFPTQLAKVERYLQKAQSTAIARPGLPNKGEAFVTQHPAYGVVDEGRINRMMRENPGSTREQVLNFLRATGAK